MYLLSWPTSAFGLVLILACLSRNSFWMFSLILTNNISTKTYWYRWWLVIRSVFVGSCFILESPGLNFSNIKPKWKWWTARVQEFSRTTWLKSFFKVNIVPYWIPAVPKETSNKKVLSVRVFAWCYWGKRCERSSVRQTEGDLLEQRGHLIACHVSSLIAHLDHSWGGWFHSKNVQVGSLS